MRKVLFVLLCCLTVFFVSCDINDKEGDRKYVNIVSISDNSDANALGNGSMRKNQAEAVFMVLSKVVSATKYEIGKEYNLSADNNTLAAFKNALVDLQSAGDQDLSIIYLSPRVETGKKDTFYIENDPMTFAEFKEYVNQIKGTVLVIADCPYSGVLIQSSNFVYNKTEPKSLFDYLFDSSDAFVDSRHFYLCSCSSEESCEEIIPVRLKTEDNSEKDVMSVFTAALLKAFSSSIKLTETVRAESGIKYYTIENIKNAQGDLLFDDNGNINIAVLEVNNEIPVKKGDYVLLSSIYEYMCSLIKKGITVFPYMTESLDDLVVFTFKDK